MSAFSNQHNPLISVIVPVYNVEQYLERCVHSITAQTYTNLEIILVDDGATDSSGAICDELAAEDDRIKVIHSENHGLSGARNLGLKHVHGDYILYVDSDDCIGKHHIENLYKTAVEHSANIAVTGFEHAVGESFSPAGKESLPSISKPLETEEAIYLAVASYHYPFAEHAWGKLYAAHLAPYLIFPEGKYFEDQFVAYRVFYEAQTIAYENANDYYYTVLRPESITGKADAKFLDTLPARKEIAEFARAHGLHKVEQIATRLYYGHLIGNYSAFSLHGQQELADDLYKMICDKRTKAFKSPIALTTKIAMLLSYLPRPIFTAIASRTQKQAEIEGKESILKELQENEG